MPGGKGKKHKQQHHPPPSLPPPKSYAAVAEANMANNGLVDGNLSNGNGNAKGHENGGHKVAVLKIVDTNGTKKNPEQEKDNFARRA